MTREHSHPAHSTAEKEPVRLVALSDGLFATVLTLLVLDLRVPDALAAGNGNISAVIKALAPHFFSYLLTFLVAGTYWASHHRYFDQVRGYDRNLLNYNLLFLLFIGLFPFSTATISLAGPAQAIYPFYWAIYAANVGAAGVLLAVTWLYAASHALLRQTPAAAEQRHTSMRQLVTPALFLLSVGVEFAAPRANLGPYTLLLIPLGLWIVDRWRGQPDPDAPASPAGWREFLWRAGALVPWLVILGLAVWVMAQ